MDTGLHIGCPVCRGGVMSGHPRPVQSAIVPVKLSLGVKLGKYTGVRMHGPYRYATYGKCLGKPCITVQLAEVAAKLSNSKLQLRNLVDAQETDKLSDL